MTLAKLMTRLLIRNQSNGLLWECFAAVMDASVRLKEAQDEEEDDDENDDDNEDEEDDDDDDDDELIRYCWIAVVRGGKMGGSCRLGNGLMMKWPRLVGLTCF
uniref:Uncharacterized protein n=1 Tax=Tanacetum cinerariifolium TaxID=118510 RepID=A0A699RBH0_TANCI|nr:hypothetical protein [Tanacetum cinerariifolium]